MDRVQIRLSFAVIISIALHIAFIMMTPEFMRNYSLPEEKEKIIEIERIDLPKQRKPEEKKEKPPEEKKIMTKVNREDFLQIPSSVEKVIDGEIKRIKLGEKFVPPPPIIKLPGVADEPTLLKSPVTFKKYLPPKQVKRFEPEGSAMIGNIFGQKKDLPLPKIKTETKFHIKQPIIAESYKAGKEKITGKEPELKIREENLKLGLKGEVIDRKVNKKPKLPVTKIDVTTTVTLDFEVMPDGTIVNIRPQKRVDLNLERVAIDYLKKWKFSNLPTGAVQKNQKGTIIIKFELE